jgi:hypothetical protein
MTKVLSVAVRERLECSFSTEVFPNRDEFHSGVIIPRRA